MSLLFTTRLAFPEPLTMWIMWCDRIFARSVLFLFPFLAGVEKGTGRWGRDVRSVRCCIILCLGLPIVLEYIWLRNQCLPCEF